MGTSRGYRLLSLAGAVLAGCVSVDELQTPYGDLAGNDPAGNDPAGNAGGAGGAAAMPAPPDEEEQCAADGWSSLRVAGREQRMDWAMPSLASGCAGAPYRLSALAPGLGAALEITLAASSGRVIDATYSTTTLGADGAEWGPYQAFVELDSLSFAQATTATEQPFDLAGTIWGPFGPVPVAAVGCARVRVSPC